RYQADGIATRMRINTEESLSCHLLKLYKSSRKDASVAGSVPSIHWRQIWNDRAVLQGIGNYLQYCCTLLPLQRHSRQTHPLGAQARVYLGKLYVLDKFWDDIQFKE